MDREPSQSNQMAAKAQGSGSRTSSGSSLMRSSGAQPPRLQLYGGLDPRSIEIESCRIPIEESGVERLVALQHVVNSATELVSEDRQCRSLTVLLL